MSNRTFAPLNESDLTGFCNLANEELLRFTEKVGSPPGRYGTYRDKLCAICLVQGAAQHFVDTQACSPPDNQVEVTQEKIDEKGHRVTGEGRVISGLKDVDICLFFWTDPALPIRIRRIKSVYATPSAELGQVRFDFIKKGMNSNGALGEAGIRKAIRHYVNTTVHGRDFLKKKSIVGLMPPCVLAQPLWITHRWAERRSPMNIVMSA